MAHDCAPAPRTCLGFRSQSQERVLGLCEQWLAAILLLVPVLHGIHRVWPLFRALIDRKNRLASQPSPPWSRLRNLAASGRSRAVRPALVRADLRRLGRRDLNAYRTFFIGDDPHGVSQRQGHFFRGHVLRRRRAVENERLALGFQLLLPEDIEFLATKTFLLASKGLIRELSGASSTRKRS